MDQDTKDALDHLSSKLEASISGRDPLDEMRRLAGIGKTAYSFTQPTVNRAQVMREQNIRPGDDAWFKLWFGKAR
jgi:hypothetical protein